MLQLLTTSWDWSPEDPSTPFHGLGLFVLDSVRVLCALIAISVIVASFRLALKTSPRQSARFLGLAILSLAVGVTEIEHLGDYASARMVLNVVGCMAAAYGLWAKPNDNDPRAVG